MTDANYDTDHVPVPLAHAPRTHAFQAAGTETQPNRLVVAEDADVDACMVSGAWLSMDAESVAEVTQ